MTKYELGYWDLPPLFQMHASHNCVASVTQGAPVSPVHPLLLLDSQMVPWHLMVYLMVLPRSIASVDTSVSVYEIQMRDLTKMFQVNFLQNPASLRVLCVMKTEAYL